MGTSLHIVHYRSLSLTIAAQRSRSGNAALVHCQRDLLISTRTWQRSSGQQREVLTEPMSGRRRNTVQLLRQQSMPPSVYTVFKNKNLATIFTNNCAAFK